MIRLCRATVLGAKFEFPGPNPGASTGIAVQIDHRTSFPPPENFDPKTILLDLRRRFRLAASVFVFVFVFDSAIEFWIFEFV